MLTKKWPLPLFLAVLVVLMAIEFALSPDKVRSLLWDAIFITALFAGEWMRRHRRS